jgi:ATP-dependent exoDNAse (exonuclease V) alpha subunit
MLFLHSHGVSTSRAVRIFKTYGEQAIEKVRCNPYMLAKDIYGIGFATADQIAQKVGIPRNSLDRARAGIDHVLLEATSDGHCALPLPKLKPTAVKLLEIQEATIEQALSHMLTCGSLLLEEIDGDALIFLPHLRKAEEGIAAKIKALTQAPMIYPPIDFEKAVTWCQQRTGQTLAPSQREALKTALENRVVVITGGPGVGKTTLVNSILTILRAKKVKCLLCAPTGRAAKRLTETTGLDAKTIHRLLEIDPGTGRFTRNESNPLVDLDKNVRTGIGSAIYSQYQLVGAVWINQPADFTIGADFQDTAFQAPDNAFFGGEKQLSSTSMESFTQNSLPNCFTCHNTAAEHSSNVRKMPASKLAVSHALYDAPSSGEVSYLQDTDRYPYRVHSGSRCVRTSRHLPDCSPFA